MLTRRLLLQATTTALPFSALGAGAARALSSEPLSLADREALALSCRATTSHDELVRAMRRLLDDEVAAGLIPADYRMTVACPYCRCSLGVAPDNPL
jgi:hypothetical protein